jgi:DnaJ-class molecular chaperone
MILSRLPILKPLLFTSYYFNHYQTLNVPPTATDEQIKSSFLLLAKKYHPDNAVNPDPKEFLLIKEAYDVLREPNSRRQYDREMFPEKL